MIGGSGEGAPMNMSRDTIRYIQEWDLLMLVTAKKNTPTS